MTGTRPFVDKFNASTGFSLKLGNPSIGMYFQFYSHNKGLQHYGRSPMIDVNLSDGATVNIPPVHDHTTIIVVPAIVPEIVPVTPHIDHVEPPTIAPELTPVNPPPVYVNVDIHGEW